MVLTNSYGVTTWTMLLMVVIVSELLHLQQMIGGTIHQTLIAKYVQSGFSSYFCQYGSGKCKTDNPGAQTIVFCGERIHFTLSYGWQDQELIINLLDGNSYLDITNAPGGSDGSFTPLLVFQWRVVFYLMDMNQVY